MILQKFRPVSFLEYLARKATRSHFVQITYIIFFRYQVKQILFLTIVKLFQS